MTCTNGSCWVALAGHDSEAEVFDTTIVLVSIEDDRATLRVADAEVSCVQGQTVSADDLELDCISVTDDTVVVLTVTRR